MFKVNNENTRRRHWSRFGVFNVNFEHNFTPFSSVSIVDFERVIVSWEVPTKLWLLIDTNLQIIF